MNKQLVSILIVLLSIYLYSVSRPLATAFALCLILLSISISNAITFKKSKGNLAINNLPSYHAHKVRELLEMHDNILSNNNGMKPTQIISAFFGVKQDYELKLESYSKQITFHRSELNRLSKMSGTSHSAKTEARKTEYTEAIYKYTKYEKKNFWKKLFINCWRIAITLVVIYQAIQILEIKDQILDIQLEIVKINTKILSIVTDIETMKIKWREALTKINEVEVTLKNQGDKINETYEIALKNHKWLREFDSWTIGIPQFRSWHGLGCWTGDTLIQIDEAGNLLPVYKIWSGMKVWNPSLGKELVVKNSLIGYEIGFIWKFTTRNGLVLSVTETHPMKIFINGSYWENVAAQNVVEGSWAMTKDGMQQFTTIEKIATSFVMVYNFEYDELLDSTFIEDRTVISNGIHTLDLYAQRMHHQNKP